MVDDFEIEIIGFDALGCLLLLDVVQPAELLELSEGGKGEESAGFGGEERLRGRVALREGVCGDKG